LVELVADLQLLVPPAEVFDKRAYSPWLDSRLDTLLHSRRCHTLVVSGGETDVCVLASVLGAIDRGYRVIVVADALCSSTDKTHDAAMSVYAERYSEQVEIVDTDRLLACWT
jgi:nicotinamidase-related amidase